MYWRPLCSTVTRNIRARAVPDAFCLWSSVRSNVTKHTEASWAAARASISGRDRSDPYHGRQLHLCRCGGAE